MTSALDAVRKRLPRGPIGPLVLIVISMLAVAAVVWGALVADPDINVFRLDAGTIDGFAIGKVTPFEDVDVYVVGLADGRVRAIDGIVQASGCAVLWEPEDRRAMAVNPKASPGAFVDPCSDGVWAMTGDAVAGTLEPLRIFHIDFERDERDVQHVYVEVIGRPSPAGDGGD